MSRALPKAGRRRKKRRLTEEELDVKGKELDKEFLQILSTLDKHLAEPSTDDE